MIPHAGDVGADAGPEVWILHGILGSGQNWRGFGRALAAAWPDRRVVLVDLRNHGESEHPPGPQTVEACVDDLEELARVRGTGPEVLIGHSFGGRVALLASARLGAPLREVWVLDALPGPVEDQPVSVPDDVAAVIDALGRLPMPVARRDDVREALRARGLSDGLAAWMTTNLRRVDDGFVWRFHLPNVLGMMRDYAALDLWPLAEAPSIDVHLVRAGRSDRWSPAALARLARVEAHPRGHVHLLPDAGHWLHVDAPQALLRMIVGD